MHVPGCVIENCTEPPKKTSKKKNKNKTKHTQKDKNKMRRGLNRGGSTSRGTLRRGRSSSTASVVAGDQGRRTYNVEVEACATCEKELGNNPIGCDECELWFHGTEMCSGLTQDMLDAISRYNGQGIKFVCMKCRIKSSTSRGASPSGKTESHMVEMVSQLYQQLRGICSVVQTLAEQVKSLTAEVKERASSSVLSTHPQAPETSRAMSYASAAASAPAAQCRPPPGDYRKVVRDELRELEEQKKRRNSLIIRGLGASTASEAVRRFETVSEYLINQKVSLSEVVKIPSETDLYRGKVSDDELRKCLLDRAKQLKSSPQYGSVFIRRDLTYHQRQEMKAKRAAHSTQSDRTESGQTSLHNNPPQPRAADASESQPPPGNSLEITFTHPTSLPADTHDKEHLSGSNDQAETTPKQVIQPLN